MFKRVDAYLGPWAKFKEDEDIIREMTERQELMRQMYEFKANSNKNNEGDDKKDKKQQNKKGGKKHEKNVVVKAVSDHNDKNNVKITEDVKINEIINENETNSRKTDENNQNDILNGKINLKLAENIEINEINNKNDNIKDFKKDAGRYENVAKTVEKDENKAKTTEKIPTLTQNTTEKTPTTSAPDGKHIKPPDFDCAPESTVFEYVHERDYQGRTYMHCAAEFRPNDGAAQRNFIPKRRVHTWHGHSKPVNAIRWFPRTGHVLLSASMDCTVKLWDVNQHRRCLRTVTGHARGVKDIGFNGDGSRFLTVGLDQWIKVLFQKRIKFLNFPIIFTQKSTHYYLNFSIF